MAHPVCSAHTCRQRLLVDHGTMHFRSHTGPDQDYFRCCVIFFFPMMALTWAISGAMLFCSQCLHDLVLVSHRLPTSTLSLDMRHLQHGPEFHWAEQSNPSVLLFFFLFLPKVCEIKFANPQVYMKSVLLLSFQILLALGCLTDGCLALWNSCRCSMLFYYRYWSMHGLHFSALRAPSSKKSLFLPWAWFQKLLKVIARRSQAFPWGSVFLHTGNQGFWSKNAVTPQWLFHAFWKSENHSFYWQLFTHIKISLH